MESQYMTHSRWELISVILFFIYTTMRLLYLLLPAERNKEQGPNLCAHMH